MLGLSPENKSVLLILSSYKRNIFHLSSTLDTLFRCMNFHLSKILSGILNLDFLPHHLDPTMWNHL